MNTLLQTSGPGTDILRQVALLAETGGDLSGTPVALAAAMIVVGAVLIASIIVFFAHHRSQRQ